LVIKKIRRSEDNPHRRTFQRAMQIAFNHLPYRPVLGPIDVISQLQPQQMRDFTPPGINPVDYSCGCGQPVEN